MRQEYRVKGAVRDILKELEPDCVWFMPAGTGYGYAGISDFVGCYKGDYFEIECKSGTNQPTALQLKHHRNVNAAGGRTLVVNELNVHLVKEFITNG